MVGSNALLISDDKSTKMKTSLRLSNFWLRIELMFGNAFIHGSVMFSKSAYFISTGYNRNYKYAQDLDLWLKLSSIAKCKNLKEPLYNLSISKNSISSIYQEKQLSYAVEILYLRNLKKRKTMINNFFFPQNKDIILARINLKNKQYRISLINYNKISYSFLSLNFLEYITAIIFIKIVLILKD